MHRSPYIAKAKAMPHAMRFNMPGIRCLVHRRINITVEEVITAAKTLKNRKATGGDNMPAEFWKTICVQDSLTCQWAACLCNKV